MRVKMTVVWVIATLAWAGAGRAQETGTVAILIDGAADSSVQTLASVLEARLSQDPRIRLLERAEMHRILEEQRLSLAGLAERDGVIKAGQLLRARAFVLLSAESMPGPGRAPSNVLIRVRVAETAHGLRLWEGYESSEESQAETVAQRVTRRVTAAVEKLLQPAGQVVPTGIIDIHRVQLGEQYDLLTRVLPRLLSTRLSTEPRLVVLERENLALLLKEKQLTEGENATFWEAGLLIDGVLQPAGGGGLEMALRWRRGGREGTVTAPVEPNAPARAADAVAIALIQAAVKTSSLARWDPQKEAEEFFRQGDLLRAHRRQENAFATLETAYALQPGKLPYLGALFENEWELRGFMFANSLINPTRLSHYSDEQLAELVSQLVRHVRRGWDVGSLSTRDLCDQWGTPSWLRSGRWTYFAQRASVSSEVVRGMNRENRRIWFEVVDRALKAQPVNQEFPVWSFYGRAALPWLSSDNPEEAMANVRRVYDEILLPPAQGGTIGFPDLRYSVCQHFLLGRGLELSTPALQESQFCGSEPQVRALWFAYLDELSRGGYPIVRFCACAARAEAAGYDADPSSQTALTFWWKAQNVLAEELHGSASPLAELNKLHLCVRLKEILVRTLSKNPSDLVAVWESVYQPLVASRNARALTWWDPGSGCIPVDSDRLSPGAAQRFRDLLTRIEAVLETDRSEAAPPTGPRQFGSPKLAGEVLGRVRGCRATLESRYRLSAPGAPRINVTMLLARKERPAPRPARFSEVQWQRLSQMLYVATVGEGGRLVLARVDLTGQTPARVVQAEIPVQWNTLAALAVMEETAYVAVRGSGVAMLPQEVWNGPDVVSNPTLLTAQRGLPSVSVTGLAASPQGLWLAYGGPQGESGLGRYDPKADRWETIFCSTLKGEEPFNAGRPYRLIGLVWVSPDCLYFVNCGRMFRDMRPWMGLWRLNTTTKNLKYYGYCGTEEGLTGYLDTAGKDCWCRGSDSLIRLNTESDEATYVLGAQWRPSSRRTVGTPRWLHCRNDLFLPEASLGSPGASSSRRGALPTPSFGTWDLGALDLSTCAIHGDELWALLGAAQIAVLRRDQSLEQARVLPNDMLEGEAVRRFVSTPYGLVALGDGAIGLVHTTDSQPVAPVRTTAPGNPSRP